MKQYFEKNRESVESYLNQVEPLEKCGFPKNAQYDTTLVHYR